ncbi:MAG: hypothetical protein ACRDRI_21335 [Pseudonocardiaceae bacterium]
MVHNVTAATRLFDVLPLVATDRRIQVVFSVIGSSAFTTGTEDFLLSSGAAPIPWDRVPDHDVDLAIAASYGGNLHELQSPLVVLPHGMGYNEDYAKTFLKKYRPIAARNEDRKVFSGLL